MPVLNTSSLAGPFTPNGSTTVFPFGFNAQLVSDVAVFDGNGALVPSALYTVALNAGDGGTVTFGTAPTALQFPQLYIALVPSFAQEADFTNTGPTYNPAQLTAALDAAASRIIALKGDVDRSILAPRGESGLQLAPAADRAGRFLAFDAEGDPVFPAGAGEDGDLRADLADDGGAALVAAKRSETGAVKRGMAAIVQERAISVKDFGAQGDNATDDTAAIENAIAAIKAEGGGRLIFPQGIYRHAGLSETDLRFVTMEGVARGSFSTAGDAGVRLVCTSATANHLSLTNPHGVRITALQFETLSSLTPTAGNVVELIGTNGGAASCDIDHIRIEKHFNGVVIDGVSNTEFQHSQVRRGVGTYAVKLVGTAKRLDQIRLKGIVTDTEVSGGSMTQNGVEILTDVHTVWIEDCSVLQARAGFVLDGAIAPEFIFFQAAEGENCRNEGFLIEKADHLRMLEVYASDNEGNGIVFGTGFNSTARLYAPCARANQLNGILVQGSGGIEIISPRIGGNSVASVGTYHGINVAAGVGNFAVIGGKCGGDVNLSGTGNQGRGIFIAAGASNNYRIALCDLTGNQATGLFDGGTGTAKVIRDNNGVADFGVARGGATVLTGATTATFAHGLGVSPARVFLTPKGNPGGGFWATADATNVTVNLAVTAAADIAFDVEALR